MKIYLDTQSAIWIAQARTVKLMSRRAMQAISDAETVLISPMVIFEMKAIYRKKRIEYPPPEMIFLLREQLKVEVCSIPFAEVVAVSMGVDWTTDPNDILITANAMVNGRARLVTSNRLIRANYEQAIW